MEEEEEGKGGESQRWTWCSRLVTVRSYAWITAAGFDILSRSLQKMTYQMSIKTWQ